MNDSDLVMNLRERRYSDIVKNDEVSAASLIERNSAYSYGEACSRAGYLDKAEVAFKRAIALRQWTADAEHCELGAVYWLQGNGKKRPTNGKPRSYVSVWRSCRESNTWLVALLRSRSQERFQSFEYRDTAY